MDEEGRLTLSMDQVPKILKPLVQEWSKDGYIVSFKVRPHSSIISFQSES